MASGSTAKTLSWQDRLREAQRLADEGAKQEFAKEYSRAFELYVRAGELYLWLVRSHDAHASTSHGGGGDVKTRIRKAADKVLQRAQLIKSLRQDVKPLQRRVLSVEEQTRTLEQASEIGNVDVPIWQNEPSSSLFAGSTFYSSPQATPRLASAHRTRNARYMRRSDRPPWANEPLFDVQRPLRGRDIVQDVVNDCSFVAALEVALEHDQRWGTRLATAPLFPKDANGYPRWSDNGRYLVKLLLNGCYRCVEVDEGIPCDDQGLPICSVGVKGSSPAAVQLWPALLEKAYLSLQGGYEFGGSSSSIDLHALTGWIPEHVGFRHSGFQREKTWARMHDAFNRGNLMITAGTGKDASSDVVDDNVRLVSSHNYAVLDLHDHDGERRMTLMNPWRRRKGWTQELREVLQDDARIGDDVEPEIFSLSWDEACTRLDSLHLSWNPTQSEHSATFHSLWQASNYKATTNSGTASQNMQVILDVSPPHGDDNALVDVWLHLAKHICKGDNAHDVDTWIAIHAFDSQDTNRASDARGKAMYVDSLHVLTRFKAKKGRYIVVASIQEGRSSTKSRRDTSFTVTAHSKAALSFKELDVSCAYEQQIEGQWTTRTAGGNTLSSTFLHNPQYTLIVPSSSQNDSSGATKLRIVAETSRDVALQVMVVWASQVDKLTSKARRVDHVVPGDIVCSSGPYSYGLAIAESSSVRPNTPYILIVSTYSPGLEGRFSVSVQSSYSQPDLRSIAAEGAGMHQQRLRDAWSTQQGTACGAPRFGRYTQNPAFAVMISRTTRATVRLTLSSPNGTVSRAEERDQEANRVQRRPHVNVAILNRESGREIASSGPYADQVCGIAIHDVVLDPGTYIIVPSTFDPDVESAFALSIYTDRSATIEKVVH